MRAHKGVRGMDALRRCALAMALIAVVAVALLAIGGPVGASRLAERVGVRRRGDAPHRHDERRRHAESVHDARDPLVRGGRRSTTTCCSTSAWTASLAPCWRRRCPTQENGGISADGKTVTVKLKPGLKWSDGTPLTAEDVAWTYNYYVDNAAMLPNMGLGAKGIKHTVAVDPTTVRIECSEPKADLLDTYLPILPKHIWKKVPPAKAGSTYRNTPPLVGSGPFLIQEWKPGSYLKLTRNPKYWGPKPAVDEIVFVVYQNAETLVSDLQTGCDRRGAGHPPGAVPGGQEPAGHHRHRLQLPQLGLPQLQLLRQPGLDGQSGPARSQVPAGAQLRHRPREAGSRGLQRFRDRRHHAHAARQLDRSRLPLAAPGGPAVLLRSRQGQPAAGRGRVRKGADGLREYHGKPISLRFWTLADNVQEQTAGKMMTGWFRQLGLKINFEVIDTGALHVPRLQLRGPHLQARLRHVHLVLGRVLRPGHHAVAPSPPRPSAATTSRAGRTPSSTS